jgi:5'(3')-deoxyribonucleotidase
MARPARHLRLGIDLDGVIADFNAGWIGLYNAEFGTSLAVEEVEVWNAPAALTHFRSMSEFWSWSATAGGGRSIFRDLEPFPDALDALGRLARRHHVVIVTTKPSFAIHDTFEWIGERRVPTREVHIVNDKSSVGCDVYLDDADHNLDAYRRVHPGALVCRYVRPWNRPRDGIVDVEGWDQFERLVDDRAGARAQRSAR